MTPLAPWLARQLRETACVARTLRFAELLPLNATVGAMVGWRIEGVSDSLDDLLSSVASSFNTLYAPAVEAMLPHLTNGPLLEVRAKPPASPSPCGRERYSPTAGLGTTAGV
jgi:hypothetical protein